jgi:hypothetical protein
MCNESNQIRPSLEFLEYSPFAKFLDNNFHEDLDLLAHKVDHCLLLLVDQTEKGQADIRSEYYCLRTVRDLMFDLHGMLIEVTGKPKHYLEQP